MNRVSKNMTSKNTKRDVILLIFLLVFIILFIISSIKVIIYVRNGKKDEKVLEDIFKDIIIEKEATEEDTEILTYKIDFDSLKQKNSDTIGYLKVNGTDIAQIVVKAKDNSYYLWHNFEKQTNSAGWIFAEYHNEFDGNDKNIIIYGHNMRNGTMFASLKNILTEEWIENEENRFIIFITEEGESIYEVFSVYEIEAEDYYMKTSFKDGEFKKYANAMKKRSIYN